MSSDDRTASGGAPGDLLAEFPAHDLAQWRAEVDRLLKGKPFERAMITRTLEGIDVAGLQSAADLSDGVWGASLPGQAPYLRGAAATGREDRSWLVAQELRIVDAEGFNAALRRALDRGQTAAVLTPAGTGREGTRITGLADLETALEGVALDRVPVRIDAGDDALAHAAALAALAARRNVATRDLSGTVAGDPLADRSAGAAPAGGLAAAWDRAATLALWAGEQAPRLRTLAVDDRVWHLGGADRALSLGLMLAGGVETLRRLEERGVDPRSAAARLEFSLTVDTDFFLEIAALRALRVLWSDVLAAAGAPEAGRARIHARTSRRSYTRRDAHVNLLRATTEAMSAVLGGADSLHVEPFDGGEPEPGALGRRIARNVHLILAQECRLDHVIDPAGGSYTVETLTRDLGRSVWSVMQEIESAGGLTAALDAGLVQEKVAAAAEKRAAELASRRRVLVGVNQYPAEVPAPAPEPAAAGTAPLPAAADLPAADTPADRMATLVAALEGGADVRALTAALSAGDRTAWAAIPARPDEAPFTALTDRVARTAAADPDRARVFFACLGDVARFMPRLDFARNFFRVGGFDLSGGESQADAAVAARAAVDDGAGVVVIVGPDAAYETEGPALVAQLTSGERVPVIVVAGQPSAWGAEEAPGRFIHLRSDVLAESHALLDNLEVRS